MNDRKAMRSIRGGRSACFAALMGTASLAGAAHAQTAAVDPSTPNQTVLGQAVADQAGADQTANGGGLQEIIVTAQKREQRLQDVPIAVTALTQEALEVNRVLSVNDLSGLAPNTTVRPGSSNQAVPSFSIRGITSTGVVAGADKEVSIYLDGVYISATRGSLFDLPDIERIEVLRGPQGTLFGRNATAGAISIVTRAPTGKLGMRQDVTVGNYDQLRTRTSIDLPRVGAFSAYASYVHNERDGDVRNLGAGTVWDRTAARSKFGIDTSPKTLGAQNNESVFAAVRFDPESSFVLDYKFDYAQSVFSPYAAIPVGFDPLAPGTGGLLSVLVNTQTVRPTFVTDARRPGAVNNSWVVNSHLRNYGHSLTANVTLTDNLTLRNIAAYRYSEVRGTSLTDGLGGLMITPATAALIPAFAPLVGRRYVVLGSNGQGTSKQWSDELQLNYDSDLLTLTVGGIWFHSKDVAGSATDIRNTFVLTAITDDGRVPLGSEGTSFNKLTSLAGFAQAEVHITPKIDAIAGIRVTRDKKTGSFKVGGAYIPPAGVPITGSTYYTAGTFGPDRVFDFDYRKTKPTYSLGLNYKSNDDVLLYAKYSTGFVSGGSVAGQAFTDETVSSWEGGLKADWLGRKLRTNLSIWHAHYKDVQSAQAGTNVARPEIGVLIVRGFDEKAKGAELEVTVLPANGLTLSGSLGYTDTSLSNISDILLRSVAARGQTIASRFLQTLNPKWTGSLAAQYQTPALFGDAHGLFRVDALYRSRYRSDPNPDRAATAPALAAIAFSPGGWTLNSRLALRDIPIGPVRAEIAAWSRNLTNRRVFEFPNTALVVSGTAQQARTYGVDLTLRY